MQVCSYVATRRKGISNIWLCGSDGYASSGGFVIFTPYAGWQDIGSVVSFTPYAITHMGSLRIVEAQVLWRSMGLF